VVMKRRVIMSATACAVAVLISAAFASGCVTHPSQAEERYPNVHIASGTLDRESPSNSEGHAVYRLTKIYRGHFPDTAVAHVCFYPNSLAATGLPEKALLILEHTCYKDGRIHIPAGGAVLGRYYYALGGDAYRGILADTPAMQARVAARSLESLSQNSWWSRLSRREALRIAERTVRENGNWRNGERLAISATRKGYGWSVTVGFVQPGGQSITPL